MPVPADDDKPDVAKPTVAESDDAKPIDDKSVDDQPWATVNDAMVPVEIIKTTVPAVSKGGDGITKHLHRVKDIVYFRNRIKVNS